MPVVLEEGEERPAMAGYEILGKLGQGGMGVVYRARQVGLNRIVALKMIKAGAYAEPEELLRFRAEAEAVARLQHPNIVQIYEVGEQNGLPYFSLELVEGGSLEKKLAGTPLPARAAAQLLETMARAVHAAHQRGIIHRDLKPANILLQKKPESRNPKSEKEGGVVSDFEFRISDFEPKVTDFGLAKRLDVPVSHTQSGVILGTPSYMAPEQAQGKGVSPAADVYALGAILYDAVTGRPPFKAESPLDTMLLVLSEDPVPPSRLQPKVPRDLETVCLKCLEKDPKKRYPSAEELADDLRRFLEGRPLWARPAGIWERTVKWARRQPAKAALVALSTVVALALVAGGLWYADRERRRAEEAVFQEAQAREQRDLAKRQSIRARRERDRANKLLAQSYVDGARLAMRRGDWQRALVFLDKALDARHPAAADLRLDKVRAWVAVNRVPEAAAELDSLARRKDLTDRQRGLVLLWQGDLALSRSMAHAEQAIQLVSRAVKHDLPRAEAAYARGLLAPDSEKAVEHFRTALDFDPYHPRANGALIMLLFTLGRTSEAGERAVFAETAFPDDPTFKLLRALIHAQAGERRAARRWLDKAVARLHDPRQIGSARLMVELCSQLRDSEEVVSLDPSVGIVSFWKRLGPNVARVLQSSAADVRKQPGPTGDPLLLPSLPPRVAKELRRLPALGVAMALNPALLRKPLARIIRGHPEGLLTLLYGITFLADSKWAKAEKAFLQAARMAAFIPVRRPALFFAVLCEWQLAGKELDRAPQALKHRILGNIRELVALGDMRPFQANALAGIARDLKELDLARWILAEWERQHPDDLDIQWRRITVEWDARAYPRVVQAAEAILKRKPEDPEAKRVKAAALRMMRQPGK
jgi:tetratricopeptide (TPR) repeat protein